MTLSDWGWSEDWAARLTSVEGEGGRPARVSTQERTLWTIQTADGPHKARIPASGLSEGSPVVEGLGSRGSGRHAERKAERRAARPMDDSQHTPSSLQVLASGSRTDG